ncbi:MAG: AbrB/MazE/SpoVT family DNA-binding domain-containing protein [Candidatus Omnitrophica bacterium]|nr:AbrB/MazE/SpoVT family DNA-binding domain-containing protein [Candidatus Omnitrophota bacterium]
MSWITTALGPKGQITLPKRIREILGLEEAGDVIGFLVDEQSGTVKLTRMEMRPVGEAFSEEDLKKLEKLAKAPGGKRFSKAEDFLRHIEKL